MKLYLASVHWYDSYKEEDKDDKAFVFGTSISNAVDNLDKSFDDIQSLTIEEIQYDAGAPIIYIPDDDDLIEKIREANTY